MFNHILYIDFIKIIIFSLNFFIKIKMIFNSTYTDKEKELEVEKMIGKKYSFFNSIRLNGVGSKKINCSRN